MCVCVCVCVCVYVLLSAASWPARSWCHVQQVSWHTYTYMQVFEFRASVLVAVV